MSAQPAACRQLPHRLVLPSFDREAGHGLGECRDGWARLGRWWPVPPGVRATLQRVCPGAPAVSRYRRVHVFHIPRGQAPRAAARAWPWAVRGLRLYGLHACARGGQLAASAVGRTATKERLVRRIGRRLLCPAGGSACAAQALGQQRQWLTCPDWQHFRPAPLPRMCCPSRARGRRVAAGGAAGGWRRAGCRGRRLPRTVAGRAGCGVWVCAFGPCAVRVGGPAGGVWARGGRGLRGGVGWVAAGGVGGAAGLRGVGARVAGARRHPGRCREEIVWV